jgi:amino acid transporter
MNPQKLPRGVSTLPLVFILFFCTSGGPYTTETLIHSVGPGLGLLMLLLVPIVWSVPEVLIVGELASMLPEEGGYYRWVDRAFGRFWAFQNGWLTWMYSLVDMAIYPVLFNQYLRYFIPGLDARLEWIHFARRHLGRDLDQFARLGSRRPRVGHCRLIRNARISPHVVREYTAHCTHPMATVCV